MQIERILTVIRFLSVGPETVATLYPKLKSLGYNCSERTIYRDLTKISEVLNTPQIRVAVSEGVFNKKTWMIVSSENDTSLSFQEYVNLFLIEHFKTKWLKKATGDTLSQILDMKKGVSLDSFPEIVQLVPSNAVANSDWSEFIFKAKHKKFLDELLRAITNKIVVSIKHYDHERLVEINYEPLRMIYHRGTVHLIACHYKNSDRALHVIELDAIESVVELDKRFNLKGSLKAIDNKLQTKFGIHDSNDTKVYKVIIHISKSAGIYLSNRFWHKSQKFKLLDDGSYHLEMQCCINIELVGWIMSWLEHMKVVSPTLLKEHIQKRSLYIHQMYKNNDDPISPRDTDNWDSIGE
ncbi:MAG: helix-turn-helix transcriptional regulator [Bacteroidota bacterium]